MSHPRDVFYQLADPCLQSRSKLCNCVDDRCVSFLYWITAPRSSNHVRTALILYEYVITIKGEIRLVWQRRPSVVAILFLLNRYGVILYGIVNLASGYAATQEVRTHISHIFAVCFSKLLLEVCLY